MTNQNIPPPPTQFGPAWSPFQQYQDVPPGQGMGSMSPPFPFRYGAADSAPTMTMQETAGGFISRPIGSQNFWQNEPMDTQLAFARNIGFQDMPTGHHRMVTQGQVMHVSPNEAARALGLSNPAFPHWEWLHMIAFSIKPTHVSTLSPESSELIERTNQPQQISENLVLGTAASNTEMLSWETWLKYAARHYNLSLQLGAMSLVENHPININGALVNIPVCVQMKYDFFFMNISTMQVTVPFLIQFDTLSHTKPSRASFEEVRIAIDRAIYNMVTLRNLPLGIREGGLVRLDAADRS